MFDNIGGFMHLGETCYVEFSWRCPGEVAFGSVWHLLYIRIYAVFVYLWNFEEHVMSNLAAGVRVK